MFVFDNLLEMDDKNLGTLIRNVDGDMLVKALKGVDETIAQPLPRLHVGARRRRHPRRDGGARPDEARRGAGGAEGDDRRSPAAWPRTARS